jgi:hypothetical protein
MEEKELLEIEAKRADLNPDHLPADSGAILPSAGPTESSK